MNCRPARVYLLRPFRGRRSPAIAALGLAISSLLVHGQSGNPNWPATVEGRVICDDGGVPARNAVVTLSPLPPLPDRGNGEKASGVSSMNTMTDFNGDYFFRAVPAGEYFITVQLDGYSKDTFVVVQGTAILKPDQKREVLATLPQVLVRSGNVQKDLVLRRGAAITGRLLVDTGGALSGEYVQAMLIPEDSTRNREIDESSGGLFVARARTDDRGAYRIAGLPKGKYRIQAMVSTGNAVESGWIQVFAPDALKKSSASVISLDYGDEISDVDITVPAGHLHSVGGVVTKSGVPVSNVSLILTQPGQLGDRQPLPGPDGTFRVDLLPPGTYTLEAEYPAMDSHVHTPRIERKITIGDSDILDANIDLP